ncbi:ABC transporter permease [Bacillus tuaregi]|uniref:ABC transporter permease n=1 Tax=Bacillus tuaregi TaxID=1816695 RepID=UPI0008F8F647|nr:ABC transporter permease subunit [Bacillus tuaregi]
MWTIGRFEWRMTLRQKTSYVFLFLWTFVLLLIFMLVKNSPAVTSYTNITGAAVNLLLYLLPLFMLIIGSFAVASEKENGQWKLLTTYPISSFSFLVGKTLGQLMAQTIIFTLSFGISLTLALVFQISIGLKWILAVYVFALLLLAVFLVIGVVMGSFSKSRWQALAGSVAIWFVLIMIWPTALISVLNLVPYTMISPVMHGLLWVNPAELLRVVFVVQMDGGSVFGQAYDMLVTFLKKDMAVPILILYLLLFSGLLLFLSAWRLERRKAL